MQRIRLNGLMLQISKTGISSFPSPESMRLLSEQFEQQHYVMLTQFLDKMLLKFVQDEVSHGVFYTKTHDEFGKELCLTPNIASALLSFLLNNCKVFQFIQAVTRCENIGSFQGRVYQTAPGLGHHDEWHNDMIENRLVAISINLSTEIFAGGSLQIRDRRSEHVMQRIANTGFGDAVVFRLSYDLQHRISDMEGTVPKTAYAGWFKSQPGFLSVLKGPSSYL